MESTNKKVNLLNKLDKISRLLWFLQLINPIRNKYEKIKTVFYLSLAESWK